jgi:hypothetical protein
VISTEARALLARLAHEPRRLRVPWRLPGRNELDALSRRSPHAYNVKKRQEQNSIALCAQSARLTPARGSLIIGCIWYEPDRRRDPDNIVSGGRKLLLDALGPGRGGPCGWHGSKVIHCDGWHCISMLADVFEIGKPGVEVVIAEVQLTLPLLERRDVAIDLRGEAAS